MKRVKQLVKSYLDAIDVELRDAACSIVPLISAPLTDMLSSGGKRIRPILCILSANMCGYSGDEINTLGKVVEIIHTSSLMHDDVIDNADTRRGAPSANIRYGNSVSVLAGDYFYAKAFRDLLALDNPRISRILTDVIIEMTAGEVLQLSNIGDTGMNIDDYYKIIYSKSGSLFAACCECAAILAGATSAICDQLREYGKNIGYAFQLRDDILDYFGKKDILGKAPGIDLEEGKVTLPVFMLRDIVGEGGIKQFFDTSASFEALKRELTAHDIEAKAQKVVESYIDRALAALSVFDDSEYKRALVLITNQLSLRNR